MGYRIVPPRAAAGARAAEAEPLPPESRPLAAQVRALYRSHRSVSLGDFAAALTCWLSHYLLTHDPRCFAWAALMHLSQLGRLLNALDHQRQRASDAGASTWLWRYVVGVAWTALAWQSAAWLLLPAPDLTSLAMLLLMILAVASGGVAGVVANRAAIWAWLLPLLLPLPAALLWHRVPHAGALGAFVLAYLALTLVFALSQHRMLMRALNAKYLNEALIEQLRQQMELAARANRDKSRFLAAASHDLRQPMHALTLFAGALEKRLSGTPDQALMGNLSECIASLDRSFNAMLDISRLDAGVVEPVRQTFAIRDVFRRLHMHFAGQAEAARLQLRFKPGGKHVTSDPQLLERVLGNLIQNAIKYTREGGVVVVARNAGPDVHIEVWDTGVGIPDAELPKVFDEFYQIDNPQQDRSRGMGMGLAIVKRLALLLNHALEVSSRPGRGTIFRIRVPRVAPRAPTALDPGSETIPAPMGQAGTLLVIDDDARIRDSMVLLLQQWGYRALPADGGASACRLARQHGHELQAIVSDLRLRNGETGLQAIQAVQQVLGRRLPALLVTGDTSKEQIQTLHDSGHPVLYKPVRPKELYAALRRLG